MWAIVVAGGQSTRFGRLKQFELLRGVTVLSRAVETAQNVCDGVVVVLPPEMVGASADVLTSTSAVPVVVTGGVTRSASVRCGLAAVPESAEIVVVHDGARPLASAALFHAVVRGIRSGADAVIPVVPLDDSIRSTQGQVADRSAFVAVQTPQAFSAVALRRAHAAHDDATDDATLVEAVGGTVATVAGESSNFKITNPEDLAKAEGLLAANIEFRIGQGFDVHRFAPASPLDGTADHAERTLVLGGVHFPGERPLVGHSDADAIAHAITDALLGAAGLGDIGEMFPDTDPALAGADSMDMLGRAVGRVRAERWRLSNVDCTVITEAPKLAPRKTQIQERLEGILGCSVTVKGKRAEQLGALGRSEGLACLAVALLTRENRR